MSRKRKCYAMDKVEYVPPIKKRRLSTAPLSPHRYQLTSLNLNHNIKLTQSQHSSEFSCASSSQFSQWSTSYQISQSQSQSSDQTNTPLRLFGEHIPDVLIQKILSYSTPFELSVCSVINKHWNSQCKIMWQRLNKCCISPKLFPSLIEDDYDSQSEYNPSRHPDRTHFTLNWIINKLNICNNLHYLKIHRTMMNGQMFQILIKNCANLRYLYLDENPWIFRLCCDNNITINNLFEMEPFKPIFELESFIIESMYINMTNITFNRLLNSSKYSLKTLILKKRDPFNCSFCNKQSLCKWHKCEDCELRSYCSRKCQSDDWGQHQYVCSYHSPDGLVQQLQNGNRLNGGFLDTICLFKNLITLDLTWCYVVNENALQQISIHCKNLENIVLNGCDINDNGIIALSNNLKCIKKLHCRAARYVSDVSINNLCETHWNNLIDLDISRCCLVTGNGVFRLINKCNKLVCLSIACGIKRGGWMWTLNNKMCNAILNNLKGLKKLQYLYANNGELSKENEMKLFRINGIEIQKITTDKQTELRIVNGHLSVAFVKESSEYINPVLMECIVNGNVVYSHRFQR